MLSTFKLTIINLLGDSFDLCVGNHTKLTNETPVASFAANLHFHISRFFKDFFLYMNVLPVHMHVCLVHYPLISLELGLQVLVSHHVRAGNCS